MVQLNFLPEVVKQAKNLICSQALRSWRNHQFQIFVRSYLVCSILNWTVQFRSQNLHPRLSRLINHQFKRERPLPLRPLLSLRKPVDQHHLHQSYPKKRFECWEYCVTVLARLCLDQFITCSALMENGIALPVFYFVVCGAVNVMDYLITRCLQNFIFLFLTFKLSLCKMNLMLFSMFKFQRFI